MKSFEFIAFNSYGKKKQGTVRAWNLPSAKKKIQDRGFYIAHISVQDDPAQNPFSFFKWLKETFLSEERIEI